jgi:hypothetical protein
MPVKFVGRGLIPSVPKTKSPVVIKVTVELSRETPVPSQPSPTGHVSLIPNVLWRPNIPVSKPKSPRFLYPRFCSMKRPYTPLSCQVDELSFAKSFPRVSSQSGPAHPSHANGPWATQVDVASVEMRTRRSCDGVPTRIGKLDHSPSLPSLCAC